MSDASLHPIVIGPFSIGQFECLGDGLLHEGIAREQPATLKDLLVPAKTSKRTPIEDRERPKKWWKAQCIHYGITVPSQAPISTYRVHLENAIRQRSGIKLPQDIIDLEVEQNAKFRRLNAEVRDATKRDEAKAPKTKSKAVKSKPEPEFELASALPKPKAKPEPKPKAETKPKDESKVKAEPKPKAEPKGRESKAKVESKERAEPKPKPKGKATDSSTDTAAAKPAASRKRKAETIVHIYYHDGDEAQSSGGRPLPVQQEIKEARRPVKKPRKVAPLKDRVSSDPPPYSEFDTPPSSSQPTSSQSSISQFGLSTTVRKGIPGAFSGTYELECTSTEVRRSYQKPFLKVLVDGNINTSFQALIVLPDFLTCLARIKPNAGPADDGYVRFEWCGRDDWSKETLPSNSENQGWLKIHRPEGRIKGMIHTPYGEFLFQGPRVDAEPPTIQWRWADFDYNAMDVDGPYY